MKKQLCLTLSAFLAVILMAVPAFSAVGSVTEEPPCDYLDVMPFVHAVHELFGEFAWDAVGIFLSKCFHHVGIVAHAAFEAHDDVGILGVQQSVDSSYDIFFYVHDSRHF